MPPPKSLKWGIVLGGAETTFATEISNAALLDRVAMMEAAFAQVNTEWRTNKGEINGQIGETEYQIQSRKGELARKFQASTEVLAWITALQLGRVTTSGSSDPYTHVQKFRTVCTINPPSTTVIEGEDCAGATGTFWEYKGMVVAQQGLDITGKGPIDHTVSFMHDGTETAKTSYSFPALTSTTKLLGSHAALLFGSAGSEDMTSVLRNLKITMNSGIVEPPSINAGVYVSEYQWGGDNPDLQIEFTIKGDKSHALYALYRAGTTCIFDLTITPSATRTVNLHCTQCIITDCDVTPSGNETQLKIKLGFIYNATDGGPGVWTFKTGKSAYLVAS